MNLSSKLQCNESLYDSYDNGKALLDEILDTFKSYPSIIIPVVFGLLLPILVYFGPDLMNPNFLTQPNINHGLYWYLNFMLFHSFCFSVGTLVSLEIIRQIESGENVNLLKAIITFFTKQLIKVLPIMFFWFALALVNDILKRLIKKAPWPINSVLNLLLGFIVDYIRIFMFMVYPATVWENKSFLTAIADVRKILKYKKADFWVEYLYTEGLGCALCILFSPIIIFLALGSAFSDGMASNTYFFLLILVTIIYSSIYIFVQQMYSSLLYMRIMKWKKEIVKAAVEKRPMPEFDTIKIPDLLDNKPDLI